MWHRFMDEAARAFVLVRAFALLVAIAGLCEASSPRASAIVAVAVAVDELLQTNRPELPDTLDDGREKPDTKPSGSPCDCPSKCGKLDCQCKAQAERSSKPGISIDAAVLSAIKATPKREELLVYSQANCPPCVRFHDEAGDGDGDIAIRYVDGPPPFAVSGFPVIHSPSRRVFRIGYATLAELRAWLGLPAVKPAAKLGAVQAVTVGTIDGRSIRAALAKLRSDGKASTISIEGVEVTIPPKLAVELGTIGGGITLGFPTLPRPRLTLSAGLVRVSQPINALALSGELLTVGLDGFPDLAFRVE